MVSVQYQLIVTKKDVRTDGPDDAEIVISVPAPVAAADDVDATVEFMRGRLKAAGHTGQLIEVLKSGAATESLRALALSVA